MVKCSLGNQLILNKMALCFWSWCLIFAGKQTFACALTGVCQAEQLQVHQELKFTSDCTAISLKLLVIKSVLPTGRNSCLIPSRQLVFTANIICQFLLIHLGEGDFGFVSVWAQGVPWSGSV